MNNNNIARVIGTVVSQFEYSHTTLGEKFYTVFVESQRLSEASDIISVQVSSRTVNTNLDMLGMRVEINGSFRSYNKHYEGKSHLILYLFVDTFNQTDIEVDANNIILNAFFCRTPTYRETPFGRKISDVILRVGRNTGKSDYLPAITWSRNAMYMSTLNAGDHVLVTGRLQSRRYMKKIDEFNFEERTAYEVSVQLIELLEEADRGEENGCSRESKIL